MDAVDRLLITHIFMNERIRNNCHCRRAFFSVVHSNIGPLKCLHSSIFHNFCRNVYVGIGIIACLLLSSYISSGVIVGVNGFDLLTVENAYTPESLYRSLHFKPNTNSYYSQLNLHQEASNIIFNSYIFS